jgi:thiol:disulfide interchange protein DsbD
MSAARNQGHPAESHTVMNLFLSARASEPSPYRHLAPWCWVLGLLLLCLGASTRAAEEFLPPEQAFQVRARLTSPQQVDVDISVVPGYYLYREAFRFTAPGVTLGVPAIPAGKVKFDENFQKNVETYRGAVHIIVPVQPAATSRFALQVVTQGCADAGLCYPPMTTTVSLDPAAVGVTNAPGGAAASGAAPRSLIESWRAGSLVDDVLEAGRFWQVVLVFFVLGLLLSLTPCVLPMLPILSSLIVGAGGATSRLRGLLLAGSYVLGMAMVYTALGVAAGLAGEGLAASLQTPWVIAGFALLLVVFALSMFDVYELRLPHRLTTGMTTQCNKLPAGRLAGVFMMGGVSALIVSPCVTGPLAGALVFISQSRDVVLGGSALFALALGMGVPLLLLGVSSGRWLPRSGPWMYAVKRLFGVLMLGVALWVAQPVLPIAAVLALWGLLLLVLGFMLKPFQASAHVGRQHVLRHNLQRALGVAALAFGVMQLVGAASGGRDALRPLAHLGSNAAAASAAPRFQRVRSVAELDSALASAAGRTVMLDFYADWCVSCKEMERFTFSHGDVAARLDKALLLKADVTANTEQERALLRRFKLFGPPGTLFFDTQGRELADARVVGFQAAARFQRTLDSAGL